MAITNQSKPVTATSATKLSIGSAFKLLIAGAYDLVIGPAISSGAFTNTAKVSVGETWVTVTTTWASETRTWLAVSQLIGNTSKPTTSFTNQSKP